MGQGKMMFDAGAGQNSGQQMAKFELLDANKASGQTVPMISDHERAPSSY
jgi:hypothetical protein